LAGQGVEGLHGAFHAAFALRLVALLGALAIAPPKKRIPSFGKGRAVWYVNRNIREALRLGILEKIASNLSWETVEGKRVMTFDDIPVRRTDALLNTEAKVESAATAAMTGATPLASVVIAAGTPAGARFVLGLPMQNSPFLRL